MAIDRNRLRGQIDAMQGKPSNYGCHFGMRSTRAVSKAMYEWGWREVEYAIRTGHAEWPERETDQGN